MGWIVVKSVVWIVIDGIFVFVLKLMKIETFDCVFVSRNIFLTCLLLLTLVSRVQSDEPSMLPCGHAVALESAQNLAARGRIKCPYCPMQCTLRAVKALSF